MIVANMYRPIARPRIALYQIFMANMDEDRTRRILEQFGFAYTSLRNADIQAGNLGDRFDTIVFADEQANAIQNGHAAGSIPPEFTGGLDAKGEEALRQFANTGGTLVFLNRATAYATQHPGVKVTNVLAGVAAKDFYCPGSLLNARLNPDIPLTRGVPENIAIWGKSGPAWETSETSALIDAKSCSGHIVLFGMRPQYRAQGYLTFKLLFNALVMNL